jgi:hypothetical protein
VGFIFGNKAAKKSAKAAEEANKIERQKGELQAMRQRLDTVRTARAAYARIQQSAENQGVSTSSVAESGESSVVSQMGNNISFLDKMGVLTDQAEHYLAKARKYQQKASFWASVDNFIISAASTAASAGAFSDRRLKEDITLIGHLEDGLPIYTYRYKGGTQLQIGVIADEVKEFRPAAYIENYFGGFEGIDMSKLNG